MDLDPAHLRSLQAIVRYGGYHRAAEALHLTQPAVSRHIRRLEEQLGEPLFARDGRGVRLTAFGERAAAELESVLAAHDRAVQRLVSDRPFVLGTIEHLADPILPRLLSVVREQLGDRVIQVRIDRSAEVSRAVGRGDIDAAFTLHPYDVPDPVALGPVRLHWWRAAAQPDPTTLPDPLPLVAYDAPCALRDLALARIRDLGADVTLTAESPHMNGVHAATRAGMGYALLLAGADGLARIRTGPLAEGIATPIWLVASERHRDLIPALRAAAWRALRSAALADAA
ncbi:LysR family transcriptional regulator [Solirubrobacter soli]|uniref:LysR family transcriptional regulator n=1 Tax=Solirubrobacter soli TaxID=363832 RepID=UPI00040D91D4|nr:LysR family transcriptional regulator [Solirubrobacter soli]